MVLTRKNVTGALGRKGFRLTCVFAAGMFAALVVGGCASPASRGRVRIVENVVVAENGALLRGENPRWNDERRTDPNFWQGLRHDFNLNTVRVLCYQPPQNWYWGGKRGLGWDADLPSAEEMAPVLDEWVEQGAREGFYVIVDYHPVGGHGEPQAKKWWSVIAPRYAHRTHVLYEACNEPVAWNPSDYKADDVAFQENIYRYIRSLAPDTHIILWSFAKGAADMVDKVDEAEGIDYANASVGWHIYAVKEDGVRRLRAKYPIIQTEIGSDNAAGYDDGARLCEKLRVSWIFLDGTTPHKAATPVWPSDPYFDTWRKP